MIQVLSSPLLLVTAVGCVHEKYICVNQECSFAVLLYSLDYGKYVANVVNSKKGKRV